MQPGFGVGFSFLISSHGSPAVGATMGYRMQPRCGRADLARLLKTAKIPSDSCVGTIDRGHYGISLRGDDFSGVDAWRGVKR